MVEDFKIGGNCIGNDIHEWGEAEPDGCGACIRSACKRCKTIMIAYVGREVIKRRFGEDASHGWSEWEIEPQIKKFLEEK